MRETAAELADLQALIDRSHKRIGTHKGLRTRPRASIAFLEGRDFWSNAHGSAVLMFKGDPAVREIDDGFKQHYGGSAFDWRDEGVYVRLDADRFFTYSRMPRELSS